MCAIVNFVVALVACSILKPRNYMPIPLKTTLRKEYIWTNLKSVFGIQAFKKDYSLILLGLWYGLSLFGYIIVLFTVSPYAIQVGLSAKQASILTAVLSATQVIGRPSMGIIADKVGRYNYVIFISIIISIFIWAYWINATTFGALVGFSILIGFSHGIGAVFCQPLASDLLDDSEQIPTVWSTLNITVSAFCMSSEVIAMKLRNNEVSNPYIGTQVFSGACFLGCAFFALLIREKVVKKSMNSKIQKLKEGNDLDTELAKELQDLETLVGSQSFAIGYLRRTFYPIKV